MNKSEKVVFDYLKNKGYVVVKTAPSRYNSGTPDFFVNNEFYVEVKKYGTRLRISQLNKFYQIKEDVYIYYVHDEVIVLKELFLNKNYHEPIDYEYHIHITLDDDVFFEVKKKKGKRNWREYLEHCGEVLQARRLKYDDTNTVYTWKDLITVELLEAEKNE